MPEEIEFIGAPESATQKENASRIKLTPTTFANIMSTYYVSLKNAIKETKEQISEVKDKIRNASTREEKKELKKELRELRSFCRMTKLTSFLTKRMMMKKKAKAIKLPIDNLEELIKNSKELEGYSDKIAKDAKDIEANAFDKLDVKGLQDTVKDALNDGKEKTGTKTSQIISDQELDKVLNNGKIRKKNNEPINLSGPTIEPVINMPGPTVEEVLNSNMDEKEETPQPMSLEEFAEKNNYSIHDNKTINEWYKYRQNYSKQNIKEETPQPMSLEEFAEKNNYSIHDNKTINEWYKYRQNYSKQNIKEETPQPMSLEEFAEKNNYSIHDNKTINEWYKYRQNYSKQNIKEETPIQKSEPTTEKTIAPQKKIVDINNKDLGEPVESVIDYQREYEEVTKKCDNEEKIYKEKQETLDEVDKQLKESEKEIEKTKNSVLATMILEKNREYEEYKSKNQKISEETDSKKQQIEKNRMVAKRLKTDPEVIKELFNVKSANETNNEIKSTGQSIKR